jgi:hypothetical protein
MNMPKRLDIKMVNLCLINLGLHTANIDAKNNP